MDPSFVPLIPISHFLSYLSLKDLARAEQACKRWFKAAERVWETLARMEFHHFPKDKEESWRIFHKKYRSITPRRLELYGGRIFTAWSNKIAMCELFTPGKHRGTIVSKITETDHQAPITSFYLRRRVNSCNIITGSADRTVKIWSQQRNYPNFTLSCHLEAHDSPVTEITGDNNHLFTGSERGIIWIWKLVSRDPFVYEIFQKLEAHSCQITAMQVDKKFRSQVLFTGGDDGTIHLWAKNQERYKRVQTAPIQHAGKVTVLRVQHREELLFSGSVDTTIKIWKYHTRQIACLRVLRVNSIVTDLVIGQQPAFLYSSSDDGRVIKWGLNRHSDPELPEWEEIEKLTPAQGTSVLSIRTNVLFPPDEFGEMIALTPKHIVRVNEGVELIPLQELGLK